MCDLHNVNENALIKVAINYEERGDIFIMHIVQSIQNILTGDIITAKTCLTSLVSVAKSSIII